MRIPSEVFGIRDLKAKSGRDSGLKVCARGGMPNITLGITGLAHQILGRDYWIKEPYLEISCEMKHQERLQKFHTDDVLQPRSFMSKMVYKRV